MEKPQLINFVAKVMEDSGFKVYKNFKTSHDIIDIYAVLSTAVGDFGVVVDCNNYDSDFEVEINLLKDMERIGENIKASKVVIVTSSYFTKQAKNYAIRKNIKLVDRNGLLELTEKYQSKHKEEANEEEYYDDFDDGYIDVDTTDSGYNDYEYDEGDMAYLMSQSESRPTHENTLYRQINNNNKSSGLLSRFKRKDESKNKFNSLVISNVQKPKMHEFKGITHYLENPIISIIIVVAIILLIALILGVLKVNQGVIGLVQLFAALVLSYGITYMVQKNRYFIIRGTLVFFVSLIILIILILF